MIKGRTRLEPKNDAHLSAIALLVLISKAQGKPLEAEVLEALIPTTYIRLVFGLPVNDLIPPENIADGASAEHRSAKGREVITPATEDYLGELEKLISFIFRLYSRAPH